jgi:hypothetical protein
LEFEGQVGSLVDDCVVVPTEELQCHILFVLSYL